MKTITILFSCCIAAMCATAQPFTIGDKIKDTELKQMFNYKSPRASLKDFSDKPMIIHFWFKNCSVCISSFGKLNKLEKQFGDKVNILLVTFDKKEDVEDLYSRLPAIKACKLPMVIKDSVLQAWFPHRTAPHDVWIDQNRIVRAIADGADLDSVNLVKFIRNDGFHLAEKREATDARVFLALDPIISNNYAGNEKRMLQYSLISNYLPEIKAYQSLPWYDKSTGLTRVKCINADLQTIYEIAYNKMGMHKSLVLINDAKLQQANYKTGEGLYCYELYLASNVEAAYVKMRHDLDSYFEVASHMEKRKMPCLVLKGTVDERLKTKETGKKGYSYITDSSEVFKNIRLDPILFQLGEKLPYPVMNESGYIAPVDMEIPLPFQNIPKLQKTFAKYGLTFGIEEREMDVIVVEKK